LAKNRGISYVLEVPVRVDCPNFVIAINGEKTRMMVLSVGDKTWTTYLVVLI